MTRMTGSEYFGRMLEAQGVTHLFYVPAFLPDGIREARSRGIQAISAHGEKAAAYMADGYARATGRPGVCMAQMVGATNLAAGLKDAYMSAAPVISFTGGPNLESQYRHVYQEIRDFEVFEPVTKWNAEVQDVSRLEELVSQAWRQATTGTPGPVHLELRGHLGQVGELEADFRLDFDTRFSKLPPFRPVADPDSVAAAAERLLAAQSPVIVAGGGVMASGAETELVALAERLSIPICTSLNAKGAIAESHPLCAGVPGRYGRASANKLIIEADLVFFVGSHAGSLVTHDWRIPPVGARVMQLDINPAELGRHYPAEVLLHGDAKATLTAIAAAVEPRRNVAWLERARTLVREWENEVSARRTSNAVPIRPERLVTDLGRALPADAGIVIDTLQSSLWSSGMMPLAGPPQRFIRCGGSLGWGLPAAIGAKCGLGDRPVVCFTGDGGLYYHLSELETMARHNINLVVVVNSNGAYACDAPLWDISYGDKNHPDIRATWQFGKHDFAQIARDLGCSGMVVEDPGRIGAAVSEAIASELPTVVDVRTDPDALCEWGWLPAGTAVPAREKRQADTEHNPA